jgi:hypothetical protein
MKAFIINRSGGAGLAVFLLASSIGAQAAISAPGNGIRVEGVKFSPFVELSAGYDSQAWLSSGDSQRVNPDGTFVDKDTDDVFAQFSVGLGIGPSATMRPEWDIRLRGWYDRRIYDDLSEIDYDAFTAEGTIRYWPESDKYRVTVGGKFRNLQDYERVPASAVQTMPAELPLPYVEDRSDRLKRINMSGFGDVQWLALPKTDFTLGGSATRTDYDGTNVFDNWNWTLRGDAGYRFSEKTSFFVQMNYQQLNSDSLSKDVPVVGLRAGFRTRPLVKVDYRIGVGAKTYEYARDVEASDYDRKWDWDVDGQLNWRARDNLSLFGRLWTDVQPAATVREVTRRSYAGQAGLSYAFLRRLSAIGSVTYRYDDYDFPIDYGNNLQQEYAELLQFTGRLVLAPVANTFWKLFVEATFERGDNDLDQYDQWIVLAGASLWY